MNGRELVAALCCQENVIVIRRPFVAWLGHVADALLIDQALYWQDRAGDGEWWHQSDEDVCERLCLTLHALYQARGRLIARGLMETERHGIPARIHYRVNVQAVVDGLTEQVVPDSRTSTANPEDKDCESKEPSIDEGGVEGVRKVTTTPTSKAKTPQPPTVQAGQPGDQVAPRTVPTRAQGDTSQAAAPRSSKTPRSSAPQGSDVGGGNRWHGVATAIMRALGRPEPRGKLPSWLGNTVAAFGAAAGDDPDTAADLVAAWATSKPLRDALAGGFLRDGAVPALAGGWIATSKGGAARAAARPSGAPDNWREIVYAPGGVRRSPVLALPRMGLEPYAAPETWPAWYRAFEGVGR